MWKSHSSLEIDIASTAFLALSPYCHPPWIASFTIGNRGRPWLPCPTTSLLVDVDWLPTWSTISSSHILLGSLVTLHFLLRGEKGIYSREFQFVHCPLYCRYKPHESEQKSNILNGILPSSYKASHILSRRHAISRFPTLKSFKPSSIFPLQKSWTSISCIFLRNPHSKNHSYNHHPSQLPQKTKVVDLSRLWFPDDSTSRMVLVSQL